MQNRGIKCYTLLKTLKLQFYSFQWTAEINDRGLIKTLFGTWRDGLSKNKEKFLQYS